MFKKIFASIAIFASPFIASAHEMYVLENGMIDELLIHPATNPLDIIRANIGQFSFWSTTIFLILLGVLAFSLSKPLQAKFDPILFKLKPYAFLIARVTVGACLILSGIYNILFGPELSIAHIFGTNAFVVQTLLVVTGLFIIVGLFVRTASIIALVIFAGAMTKYGTYLLTYLDYIGILLVLVLLGGGKPSLQNLILKHRHKDSSLQKFRRFLYLKFSHHAFFIIRVTLGLGIMYAAFYGKFLHSDMALQVVNQYNLTNFFPFEPSFVVLGAGILEMLFGLFFVLGVQLRFTVIFFATFLTLSYLYFPEAAWPHLILVGLALAIFAHGYDDTTIEGKLFKKGKSEPVL